jgi:hypothetical protein
MEYSMEKIPPNFCVICKLHNVCIDRWMMNHPTVVHIGCFSEFSDLEAPSLLLSGDKYLWDHFDLDDVCVQPTDDIIIDWLRNHNESLLEKRHCYAARNKHRRNEL